MHLSKCFPHLDKSISRLSIPFIYLSDLTPIPHSLEQSGFKVSLIIGYCLVLELWRVSIVYYVYSPHYFVLSEKDNCTCFLIWVHLITFSFLFPLARTFSTMLNRSGENDLFLTLGRKHCSLDTRVFPKVFYDLALNYEVGYSRRNICSLSYFPEKKCLFWVIYSYFLSVYFFRWSL